MKNKDPKVVKPALRHVYSNKYLDKVDNFKFDLVPIDHDGRPETHHIKKRNDRSNSNNKSQTRDTSTNSRKQGQGKVVRY